MIQITFIKNHSDCCVENGLRRGLGPPQPYARKGEYGCQGEVTRPEMLIRVGDCPHTWTGPHFIHLPHNALRHHKA